MVEYLAAHNVTMVDFVILLALWLAGVFLFWRGFRTLVKNAKEADTSPQAGAIANMMAVVLAASAIVFFPIMLCGFWHFLNMVLTLFFGFNLY